MFFVIEISTGDASIAGSSIYRYDDLNAAIGAFHQRLGNAMRSPLFDTDLCVVMDIHGAVYRTEEYIKAVEEPEEE